MSDSNSFCRVMHDLFLSWLRGTKRKREREKRETDRKEKGEREIGKRQDTAKETNDSFIKKISESLSLLY